MTLPLFDPAPPFHKPFDKAALAGRLRSLASQDIWIGTSSWKYPGWLDQIYSRDRYTTRGRFSQKRFEAECLTESRGPRGAPGSPALIFVNNRFEGNAPAIIQAITE